MPNRKTHNKINKLLFDKEYDKINRIIDYPSKFLGVHHRKILHSDSDLLILSMLSKNPVETFVVGKVHTAIDKIDNKITQLIKRLL